MGTTATPTDWKQSVDQRAINTIRAAGRPPDGSERRDYLRFETATVRREIDRDAVPRLMTPFDAALSIDETAVFSSVCASFVFLPPIAARSRLMMVRMAVFWAVLRAVRVMRWRFAFSDDLMFAILRRASW